MIPFLVHFSSIFCSVKNEKKKGGLFPLNDRAILHVTTPQQDPQSSGHVGKPSFQNQPSLTLGHKDGAFRNKLQCSIQLQVPRPRLHNKECGQWKGILFPSGVVNMVGSFVALKNILLPVVKWPELIFLVMTFIQQWVDSNFTKFKNTY